MVLAFLLSSAVPFAPVGRLQLQRRSSCRRMRALHACEDGIAEDGVVEDVEDARRFLDLEQDPDVEAYLVAGQDALGRQCAVLLPNDDSGVEAALLLAARKLVKLGASVRVIKPESDPRTLRAPYPRVEQVVANLSSAEDMSRCLLGVHCLLLAADLPADMYRSLEAALATNAAGDSVEQLVVLSSVAVYGAAVDEGALEVTEERPPQPESIEACALLANEKLLGSLPPRCAVLRCCAVYEDGVGASGGGMLATDALLSDVIGLQELLDELLAELDARIVSPSRRRRSGSGSDAAGAADERRAAAAAAATAGIAALLPPADAQVQMTHVADLAGACAFAFLSEIEGAYHVCSEPGTLQQLFDAIAEHRGWDAFELRPGDGEGDGEGEGAGQGEGEGEGVPFFSNAKLRGAGYQLRWPGLEGLAPPDESELPPDGVAGAVGSVKPTRRLSKDERWGAPAGEAEGVAADRGTDEDEPS